jgi:hypothetical protein
VVCTLPPHESYTIPKIGVLADLHPGNFGLAAPELNKFSDFESWDRTSRPHLLATIPVSPTHDRGAFPLYICGSIDLGWLLLRYAAEFMQRPL